MRAGVFYKWQMLVTIVIAIPCHELYIRTILQNQLQQKLSQPIIAIVIAALASSSLFLYLGNIPIFVFILLAQLILRSEEHTSELQSRFDLVCRLLLEK